MPPEEKRKMRMHTKRRHRKRTTRRSTGLEPFVYETSEQAGLVFFSRVTVRARITGGDCRVPTGNNGPWPGLMRPSPATIPLFPFFDQIRHPKEGMDRDEEHSLQQVPAKKKATKALKDLVNYFEG